MRRQLLETIENILANTKKIGKSNKILPMGYMIETTSSQIL